MKQTPDDLKFASLFAEAIRPHVSEDVRKGDSMAKIGAKLGVSGPGLQKYLDGETVPSLRTIVLAFIAYGISVPYNEVEISMKGIRKKRKRGAPENQLFLPFEIIAPSQDRRVGLKLLPTGVRKYQLQITLRMAR